VHFKGLIPEAARLLPALDVYAQTSLSEGPVAQHAGGHGRRPADARARPWSRAEIHGHEETALLVPAGDRLALGSALQRLAGDAELRARLGARAAERARRHSIEPMVDAYETLYRELATRS